MVAGVLGACGPKQRRRFASSWLTTFRAIITLFMVAKMPDPVRQVRPIRRCSKAEVSAQVAIGWARVTANRQGAFADAMDIDVKTVRRALSCETTPELHTALNSLLYDSTALDEVLALYGYRLEPDGRVALNDMQAISDLCELARQYAMAMADGRRDHCETLDLADTIRPLQQVLSAICAEAAAIRGAH